MCPAYTETTPVTMAPWQQDYFASTAIQAAQMGNADALTFLNWEANFLVGRFLNGANGFNPHDGAAYNLIVGNGTGTNYKTWAQIEQATIAAGASNGNGWADGNYAELAAQTLAGIITLTGSAAATQAYNWLMSSGAPYITPYFSDPQFDIDPGHTVSTDSATLSIAAVDATQSEGAPAPPRRSLSRSPAAATPASRPAPAGRWRVAVPIPRLGRTLSVRPCPRAQ